MSDNERFFRKTPVTPWKNWRDIFASETVVHFLQCVKGRTRHTDYKSKTIHTWVRKRVSRTDDPGPMKLSSFVTVESADNRRTHLDVTLTPQAIDVIRANLLHIDDDMINVQVIVWEDGRALVEAHHGKILGSVWLAFIDSSTIPAFPRRYEVRSSGDLEGLFDDEISANAYAAELRSIGARGVTVEPE